jgi:hypothetical protein
MAAPYRTEKHNENIRLWLLEFISTNSAFLESCHYTSLHDDRSGHLTHYRSAFFKAIQQFIGEILKRLLVN